MPYSGEMKNARLEATITKTAPTINPEYASFGTAEAKAPAKEAAAAQRVIEFAATVPATGSLVCVTEVNGKTVSGEAAGPIVVGEFYYVRKVSATEAELAFTKTQSESATAGEHLELTVAIKTTSKFEFITEGTIKERVITHLKGKTVTNGKAEDATALQVESTAVQTAKYVLYFSAVTAGTFVSGYPINKSLESGDKLEITKSVGEELGP